jgi:hypothetical protein
LLQHFGRLLGTIALERRGDRGMLVGEDGGGEQRRVSPRSTAELAYSNSRSGVRWAETTRTSKGTESAVSVSAACVIVDQSERDPMMTPTSGFIGALYSS